MAANCRLLHYVTAVFCSLSGFVPSKSFVVDLPVVESVAVVDRSLSDAGGVW